MSNKLAYDSISHLLPLFHQPWWLDAVCEGEWDVVLVKEKDEIVAVWPYQIEKKWGFNIVRNPLLTPYLGPFLLKGNPQELVLDLWQQLPKADMIQWSFLPDLKTPTFILAKGIISSDKYTYYIDLSQTIELIWANIHPKRKNAIRKAEQDLELRKEPLNLPLFVEWHRLAFTEKGKSYPFTVSFFEKIVQQAALNSSSTAYAAYDDTGLCVGMIWLAFDAEKMYYLLSATPAKTHRGAIALLLWSAIREAKGMGLLTFDFEGSVDEGIAHFFQRFGGVKMSFTDNMLVRSPLWKLKQKILG